MILLDTHALYWYTHRPERLSKTARREIEKAHQAVAYVSALAFWEIGLKVAKNRWEIPMDLLSYRAQVKELGFIIVLPVDEFVFIDSVLLEIPHRDPVDRMLIATAKRKNLKIVTCDPAIRRYYRRTVW
ncbi:MAG: VapC toxin family PIN domain ribonuclease [Phototrophicales bacterium]|nr:MAG: VapC toxin family PIN domain ribonuclease [Phototrophicales bacterium]